jgi:hypothetical protein
MGISGRIIMGAMAAFIAVVMLRAWRPGRIRGGVWGSFTIDDNPVMYTLLLASQGFIVGMMLWGAAGYDPRGYLDLFGLGVLDDFYRSAHHLPPRA